LQLILRACNGRQSAGGGQGGGRCTGTRSRRPHTSPSTRSLGSWWYEATAFGFKQELYFSVYSLKGGKQINYRAVGQSFLTERLVISLTRRPPTPPDRPSHQDRRGAPAFFKHPRLVCRAYPSRSVDYEYGTNDGEDRGSTPRFVTAVVWLVYNSRHDPTALKPQ
jgi:hypothetical protein